MKEKHLRGIGLMGHGPLAHIAIPVPARPIWGMSCPYRLTARNFQKCAIHECNEEHPSDLWDRTAKIPPANTTVGETSTRLLKHHCLLSPTNRRIPLAQIERGREPSTVDLQRSRREPLQWNSNEERSITEGEEEGGGLRRGIGRDAE